MLTLPSSITPRCVLVFVTRELLTPGWRLVVQVVDDIGLTNDNSGQESFVWLPLHSHKQFTGLQIEASSQ